jgi:uncharacterized protein (DUF1697 family)
MSYQEEIKECLEKIRATEEVVKINKRFWFEKLAKIREQLYKDLITTMTIEFGDEREIKPL